MKFVVGRENMNRRITVNDMKFYIDVCRAKLGRCFMLILGGLRSNMQRRISVITQSVLCDRENPHEDLD
jgi:hypothetical protein